MQPNTEHRTPMSDVHEVPWTRQPAPPCATSEQRQLLPGDYPSVERGIRTVSRQFGLTADDTDELRSQVWLKLLENSGRVFRRFNGKSRLSTYLTRVIARIYLDGRRAANGRWRPSAEARRHGSTAILLERLLMRDGYSFEEACEVLKTNFRVIETPGRLEEIYLRLPIRTPQRIVGETVLAGIPHPEPALDGSASTARRINSSMRRALSQSIRDLEPRDRRILRLRFQHDWTAQQIAEDLGVTAKTVYRRLDQILAALRSSVSEETIVKPTREGAKRAASGENHAAS